MLQADPTKFTFIVPPSPWVIKQNTFPPLGIGYLVSVLKQNGHEVQVIDMALGQKVPDSLDSDVICYTGTTQHFPIVYDLFQRVFPSHTPAIQAIGGPHASCLPRQCLDVGFDYTVVGEGENSVLRLAHPLVPALRTIIEEPPVEDLDSIPFPDWDAIRIKDYEYEIDGAKSTTVITSRGCPFKCAFCCKVWTRTVRFRRPENVVEEVRVLKENYGYEGVMFFDDTFILDKDRVRKLCQLLKPLNIVWRAETRVTDDYELLKLMSNSGCTELAFGVESGSDDILQTIDKGITVNQAKETVMLCHKAGIKVKEFLMIGLPGESKETVEATRQFIHETEPDDLDYSIFFPYPKSTIYDEKQRFDIQFDIDYSSLDWMKYFEPGTAFHKGVPGHYKSVVRTSHLSSEDIVRLRDEVEAEFKVLNPDTRRFQKQ
jgi:anaerobic magnesium-protoporphyrin IX monomethyl ester cyclase